MIKLNILNMDNFLQTVNACSDAVNLLTLTEEKKISTNTMDSRTICCISTGKIRTSCVFHWIFRLQRII